MRIFETRRYGLKILLLIPIVVALPAAWWQHEIDSIFRTHNYQKIRFEHCMNYLNSAALTCVTSAFRGLLSPN